MLVPPFGRDARPEEPGKGAAIAPVEHAADLVEPLTAEPACRVHSDAQKMWMTGRDRRDACSSMNYSSSWCESGDFELLQYS